MLRFLDASVPGTVRQQHREGGDVVCASDPDFTAVKLHNPFYNSQTHPVSLGGVGFVRLVELVEDLFLMFRGNLAAGIGYGNFQALGLLPDLYPDGVSLWGKFHRIVQQIQPHLLEQFFIGLDGVFPELHLQLQVFAAPFSLQHQNARADLLRQVEAGNIRQDGLVFHLGQVQYVGSHIA